MTLSDDPECGVRRGVRGRVACERSPGHPSWHMGRDAAHRWHQWPVEGDPPSDGYDLDLQREQSIDPAALRVEFIRLLTVDGPTRDRRRRDFNQAIFAPESEGGWAVFNGTSLDMVLLKFDRAVSHG